MPAGYLAGSGLLRVGPFRVGPFKAGLRYVLGMHVGLCSLADRGGGQPTRQDSAAREPAYRPPPRQISSSIPCIMAFRQ
jgi:hypothetical protein